MQSVAVIGSGFAGMAAATFLAKEGYNVTVFEKNEMPGGRAAKFSAKGFTFDMGPSWYWMPDVFERYFSFFGKKVSDYYELIRLDPSYRIYDVAGAVDIPASYDQLKKLFETFEKGSGGKLDKFLEEAAFKYEVGIHKLVHKPGLSIKEFADWDLVKGVLKLDVFTSMHQHVRKFFSHPLLIKLMEFPVLFLGAMPSEIPALYSLMNYADIKLGTWYPQGGMHRVAQAMYELAVSLGVNFHFNHTVTGFTVDDDHLHSVTVKTDHNISEVEVDAVVAGADYHHIESLLPEHLRTYSEDYWNKRTMAPSCLLYYVGLDKKIKNVRHHSLFFDSDFQVHGEEIYKDAKWPTDPLFYVCANSVTDPSAAPEGCENLFILIPVAAGLQNDNEDVREHFFKTVLQRMEKFLAENISDHIIYKRSFSVSDFTSTYNAFKGNAYGLANTLKQTAILKPSMRSKKVPNLFFAGQLTVPGPGVPPSLISGEIAAKEVNHFLIKSRKYDKAFS